MVTWLLNLCYLVLLLSASPWLAWRAWRYGKYRQGWGAKWWGAVPPRHSDRPCIWLHAVSVGEVVSLGPLLRELGDRDFDLVISTTTQTGYATACKRYPQSTVVYCPLDFSWAVRRALDRIRPDLLVLAELELWPNLIRLATRRAIPVALVNARLSRHSYRGYRRAGRLLRSLFRSLSYVGVQSETYADRFRQLGVPADRIDLTGSLKFDGAVTDRNNDRTTALADWARISPHDIVFCAGSTQAPEERMALDVYRRLAPHFPQLRLFLVPRHPERFDEVARLLEAGGIPWSRRSCDASGSHRIVLVDTIGELGAWWGTAHIAYVGGSMGKREGQNMIEPAAYGAAVAFGPRTRNFRDVVALLRDADAAVVVHDTDDLESFVRRAVAKPTWRTKLGRRAQQVVLSQRGAARRTANALRTLLPAQPSSRRPVKAA